jgi:hypothetical protein
MGIRKMTAATQFIQELSVLLDNGKSFPIETVHEHLEKKDVIDWLEQQFPLKDEDGPRADFTMFQADERKFLHDELEQIWGARAGDERRKWGITKNGLCLLISWTTEIIRHTNHEDRT